jgi:hypothetical protein
MDYLEITQTVIDQATAAGADAEAYLTVGKETNIEVNQGEVAKFSFAGSKGLGVRVIRNGRMGYAYTSDFTPTACAAVPKTPWLWPKRPMPTNSGGCRSRSRYPKKRWTIMTRKWLPCRPRPR